MTQLSRKAFLRTLLSFPCLIASGCASWFYREEDAKPPSRLPQVEIPSDVIVAEVSLIRVREPQLALVDAAWKLADEQVIPVDRRRDLDANGFRCGRFGTELAEPLRELLQIHEEQMALAKVEGEDLKGDPTLTGLRMQLQAARKGEIRVRSAQPQISVLLNYGGVVRGGAFPSAACSFQVRSFPAAAASAEIELTPYIEFGLPMREWGTEEGELSMNIAKPKELFAALRMNARLSPGEVLLVGPSSPPRGLGGVFFHEQPIHSPHSLLLIRLALSHADDLFTANPASEP